MATAARLAAPVKQCSTSIERCGIITGRNINHLTVERKRLQFGKSRTGDKVVIKIKRLEQITQRWPRNLPDHAEIGLLIEQDIQHWRTITIAQHFNRQAVGIRG